MSSGKAHALASTAIASAGALIVFVSRHDVIGAFGLGAGALLGVFLSPDLDVDGITYGEALLPWLLRVAFRAYWWPYAKLVPHRHWVSHAPIISTIVRVVYAFWWFALIDAHLFVVLLPVWIGLAASDVAHWLMDMKY